VAGAVRTLGYVTRYHHVDVFTAVPYAGNSLAVFVDPPPLGPAQLAAITRELRHFESIFVETAGGTAGDVCTVRARVFDLAGELEFAGHPVLGAAAVLHRRAGVPAGATRSWNFELPARTVRVDTTGHPAGHVAAILDQGRPETVLARAPLDRAGVAAAVGLRRGDLDSTLPLAIVSIGLRYLIVPVRRGALDRARIAHPDFEGYLAELGAQFAYLIDAAALEGRHWNNDGVVEDVATGSAAGCVAAYLLDHGRLASGTTAHLAQGRHVGRPSFLAIAAYGAPGAVQRVVVGGDVAEVATGELRVLPPAASA